MEKKEKKQLNISRNKICITLVFAFIVVFAIMVVRYRMTYKSPTEVYHEDKLYEFVWEGTTYKGIYKGDFQNTQPNGYGSFEDRAGGIKYIGIWQKGLLSGVGMLVYSDGSIEVGEFSEGKRNGLIRRFEAGTLSTDEEKELSDRIYSIYEKITKTTDGDTYYIYDESAALGRLLWKDGFTGDTFTETFYEEDIPYAGSETYINGQIVSKEYYINATPMSTIINEAKPLTEKLIKKDGYLNKYIYIDGEVVFSGDASKKSYVRVNTDAIGMVYGVYESTYGLTSGQAYVPNLKQGDKVRIYGYYMGLSKYNLYTDKEGYGNRYAKIMPYIVVRTGDFTEEADAVTDENVVISGVKINRPVRDGKVLSYEGVIDNPYFSNMEKIEDTFVIKNITKTGSSFTIDAYLEDKPNDLLTLIYEGDVLDKFLTGSRIKVAGYLMGQTRNVVSEKRDEILEDGVESDDIMTYEFNKRPVVKVEELED